jgi:tRNA(Ile)-lysidine synthase
MHALEKKTALLLDSLSPSIHGETIIVAVSGGPDSMALLHVLSRISPSRGISPVAVNIDHGLRPDESAAEAQLVKSQAEALNIPCLLKKIDVTSFAAKQGLSIEEAARLLRYEVLNQAAEQHKTDKIAVAHTADDQAEEILIRLIRGSGRKGLSGMETFRQSVYLRPFLKVHKKELLSYLAEKNIPFLEDSSNQDRNFLRNRVRLDLLPYLAEHFNENISRTLLQTADILQEEEELLEEICNREAESLFLTPGADAPPATCLSLDLEIFMGLPKAIKRRLLEKSFWQAGNRPQFRVVEQVLAMVEQTDRGNTVHGSRGLRITRQSNQLHFCYPAGRTAERGNLGLEETPSFSLLIETPGTFRIEQAGLEFTIEILDRVPERDEIINSKSEYLDLNSVSFPLVLRSPRPGDRFFPLNSPGSKKVGDFLTDQKISRHQRWKVPVLESGHTIAALVGLRISHAARITENTGKVLKISRRDLRESN